MTKCYCKLLYQCLRGEHGVERNMEELLRTCVGSESKLNTSVDKLAQLIATEFQRMSLGQEDKMRELPISNQRLQTELHLIKTEFTSNK